MPVSPTPNHCPTRGEESSGKSLRDFHGKPVRVVNCPSCGKPVPWSPESRFRPFCSERCRINDLGAWAAERYRLPEPETGSGSGQPGAGG